jgi:hypothetical protein
MRRSLVLWAAFACAACLLLSCGSAGETATAAPDVADLLDSAAAEATLIVQQARATAIVLEARAQATALVAQAGQASPTPPPVAVGTAPLVAASTAPAGGSTVGATLTAGPLGVAPTPVEVTSVGFAAEGGLIVVRFRAPPSEAAKWWPGSVSVADEATGTIYDEIPVMPRIGPLIGRPKREGQPGYVMLVNAPPGLPEDARVTVLLGAYTFEHVPVK